ncbi:MULTISPECIES: hypothetical protein [Pseudomonas]|uniref:hypothetical protein n=1 Tax=Pseudomonas citronellolis TaxID=53408 RepID=UPI000AE1CD30|nr:MULTISPECIES: hypothetical protein [Pseudomonas]
MKIRVVYALVFVVIAFLVYACRPVLDAIFYSSARWVQVVVFFILAGVSDYVLKKIFHDKE